MERFVQVSVDGFAAGSSYAALALAIVLIFRSTGVVNFAQGEMAMVSTFGAWALLSAGLPLGLAALGAVAGAFAAGVVIQRLVLRPFQGTDHLTTIIATLGVFLILNSLAAWTWGPEARTMPSLFGSDVLDVGGVRVAVDSLGMIAVVLGVAGGLFALSNHTSLGLQIRAAALSPETSRLMGVRVDRMVMFSWGLAAAIGALAGILLAPQLFLDFNFMSAVLIYAFAAAALGGFDSPGGAVVGGWSIGLAQAWASTYVDFIGTDLQILVPIAVLLLVLVVRPSGLFGSRQVVRL